MEITAAVTVVVIPGCSGSFSAQLRPSVSTFTFSLLPRRLPIRNCPFQVRRSTIANWEI